MMKLLTTPSPTPTARDGLERFDTEETRLDINDIFNQ